MANLALVSGAKVRPVTGIANGHEQYDFEAEEQIDAGQVFRINTTTGKATKSNATTLTEAGQVTALGTFESFLFVAIVGARQAGNMVTGMKVGLIDGFDLSAPAYGARIWLSDTDGTLADAAGTNATLLGRVLPSPYSGTPSGADKILRVNCPPVV